MSELLYFISHHQILIMLFVDPSSTFHATHLKVVADELF